MKKPTPTKPSRPRLLDDVTLAHVVGGDTRDAASGLPTGKRIVVLDDAKLVAVRGGDGTATAPRDSVSGNSTGRRQHKPFT